MNKHKQYATKQEYTTDFTLKTLQLTKRNIEALIYMLPSVGNRIDRQSLETWLRTVNDTIAQITTLHLPSTLK